MSSEPARPGRRPLVLDTNILVRAVLGRRVLSLLEAYTGRVNSLTPEIAFASARAYLPEILIKRGLPPDSVAQFVEREIVGRRPILVRPGPHESVIVQPLCGAGSRDRGPSPLLPPA